MGVSLWAAFSVGYVSRPLGWPKRIMLLVLIAGLCVPLAWINIACLFAGLVFFAWEGLHSRPAILGMSQAPSLGSEPK
jgi:TRAP-type uncharacterized transport system fused permease subunit